jgi:hypothetical protein
MPRLYVEIIERPRLQGLGGKLARTADVFRQM